MIPKYLKLDQGSFERDGGNTFAGESERENSQPKPPKLIMEVDLEEMVAATPGSNVT